jgi:membrane protein required for colicin V production
MNWLDVILIIFLIASFVFGLWQGFIRALLSVVGMVVGVILASNFYPSLAKVLGFISNPEIANIVAFAIILVAVMIVFMIIAALLRSLLETIKLGCIDRIAGGVLGVVVGALFISALLAGIVKFFGQGVVTSSVIAGFLLDKFPFVLGLLPSEFKVIRDFFQ